MNIPTLRKTANSIPVTPLQLPAALRRLLTKYQMLPQLHRELIIDRIISSNCFLMQIDKPG